MGVSIFLEPDAEMPRKSYETDAGWDLFVSKGVIIPSGKIVDVHTGVHMNLPRGMYGRITGRSSTLRKHNLLVNEGIIDSGFTGELFICVKNLGNYDFRVSKGSRLAQIILGEVPDVTLSLCEKKEVLPGARGDNGFGSTGL